ncbi:MAG: glycosyltransferase [Lentisphaeria bacterium]
MQNQPAATQVIPTLNNSWMHTVFYFSISILPGVLGFVLLIFFYRQPWIPSATFASTFLPIWAERFATVLILINLVYFLWQIGLYLFYHETPSLPNQRLPECDVIIPVYNESKQITDTIQSILNSNYPTGKLNIIIVDDGSTDDTWHWVQLIQQKNPEIIHAIKLKKNSGKRAALHRGIRSCKNEMIVTIDSDSEIEPHTLRRMVTPLCRDHTIGGVAGNIRVLNIKDGFIPKMLEVNFLFCFEFIRSAQSVLGAVMCSPGALSSYRRSIIDPHLDTWRDEKFFGRPSNIGDDRALTNIILKSGYRVTYQRTATAYTSVPVTYTTLCKMLIRWARSNIRENLSMATFIFKKRDKKNPARYAVFGTQINLLVQTIWMILPLLSVILFTVGFIETSGLLLFPTLPPLMIWATFPALLYYLRQKDILSLWSYYYSVFYFFTLFWIAPYSLLSFFSSDWLTRKETPIPSAN